MKLPPLERPKPLTDKEFKDALCGVLNGHPGALYAHPMFVVRLRKVFRAAYDPAPRNQPFVGKLFGVELFQTPDIPDGWVYAPPDEDSGIFRHQPADPRYLIRYDPLAGIYVPPKPIPTRYDRLMDREP